jgi:hypothetical protein
MAKHAASLSKAQAKEGILSQCHVFSPTTSANTDRHTGGPRRQRAQGFLPHTRRMISKIAIGRARAQPVRRQRIGQLDDLALRIGPGHGQPGRYGRPTRELVQLVILGVDQSEDGGKDGTFQSTAILTGNFRAPREPPERGQFRRRRLIVGPDPPIQESRCNPYYEYGYDYHHWLGDRTRTTRSTTTTCHRVTAGLW